LVAAWFQNRPQALWDMCSAKRSPYLDRHGQALFEHMRSVSRRRRSFHRLGVTVAGVIIAVGLVLIGAAAIRLDLARRRDVRNCCSFTLVFLGTIAIAAYGVVRAIKWASRG